MQWARKTKAILAAPCNVDVKVDDSGCARATAAACGACVLLCTAVLHNRVDYYYSVYIVIRVAQRTALAYFAPYSSSAPFLPKVVSDWLSSHGSLLHLASLLSSIQTLLHKVLSFTRCVFTYEVFLRSFDVYFGNHKVGCLTKNLKQYNIQSYFLY